MAEITLKRKALDTTSADAGPPAKYMRRGELERLKEEEEKREKEEKEKRRVEREREEREREERQREKATERVCTPFF